MQTKKLHELIEMAQQGKRFYCWTPHVRLKLDHEIIRHPDAAFNKYQIVGDWEYEEIREPEVVRFVLDCTDKDPDKAISTNYGSDPESMTFAHWCTLKGKKWTATFVEKI